VVSFAFKLPEGKIPGLENTQFSGLIKS